MTLMFCAFEGNPQILRLYGTARTIQRGEPDWDGLFAHFEPLAGARQIFDLAIERVQTSCGMAVPHFSYGGDRTELDAWARRQGPDGIARYWHRKNRRSIDGLPAPIPAPLEDGPA